MKIKFPLKEIKTILKKQVEAREKAIVIAYNLTSRKLLAERARKLSKQTGQKVGTVKKAFSVTLARHGRVFVIWDVIDGRPGLNKPKQIGRKTPQAANRADRHTKKSGRVVRKGLTRRKNTRAGVSYKSHKRGRKKLTSSMQGGSKPFMIIAENSGKLIAVYRPAGRDRHVKKIAGQSVPYALQENFLEDVSKKFYKYFEEAYPNALGRVKYVKPRRKK